MIFFSSFDECVKIKEIYEDLFGMEFRLVIFGHDIGRFG